MTLNKIELKRFLLAFILVLSLKAFMDWTYLNFVYPNFSYSGFKLDISYIKVLESYILACILGVLIFSFFNAKNKPSKVIVYILYINVIIPILSLYGLENNPRGYVYVMILGFLALIVTIRFSPKIKIVFLKQGWTFFIAFATILSGYVYLQLILSGGLSRINFNLLDVYEVRESYGGHSGALMGYFLPWQAYVINMILLWYGLYRKNFLLIILMILAQLLIFGMTGFKSFLFAPMLVIVLYRSLIKDRHKKLFGFILQGSIVIFVVANIAYLVFGDIVTPSIFIRRLFFIPAQLNAFYFDFFSEHTKLMLSHSILGSFIKYPYDLLPPQLIAFNYHGRIFAANTGYLGEAYANFGVLGVVCFSILLGVVLNYLDSISDGLPISLPISVIIIPGMALVNSALLTVLFTHGLLVAIFCLWLFAPAFKRSL